MIAAYQDFLASKRLVAPAAGVRNLPAVLHPQLEGFRADLTRWALRKGRALLAADTGLGKTFMQLVWATYAAERTLVIAPLTVAQQTVREGAKWRINVTYARSMAQAAATGITVTNYEMVEHFDVSAFGAVVLDESSILKNFEGKVRTRLIETFAQTPMRLCCTATPAPNDIAEIANHAEFLGVMTRAEMLAAFFVHDDEGWRLKGHAREPFYRWLASWAMAVKKPSDLGYSDDGFDLPPLSILPRIIPSGYTPEGQLFHTTLKGVGDRARVRQATLSDRVDAAARLIATTPGPWIAWVGLNEEGRALAAQLPDAVLIEGSLSPEAKAAGIEAFLSGERRVMVSKPSITGFGLNLQDCAQMVFVGLSDSFESYYQCIRRCWRFGQTRPVAAHIVLSEPEEPIYFNVLRKEKEAEAMTTDLVRHVAEFEREEIAAMPLGEFNYQEREATGDGWRFMLGDSAERLAEVADDSVGLSVFSPPFLSLFTYSNTERDLGNARTPAEFWAHFRFIIDHLLRVTMPGRNCCVHVAQVPSQLAKDGVIGLKDFRGGTIAAFEAGGWVYHGEVCIDKDPQAQAIRTHSKALLFTQLRKDSSWLRPALADYILVFRKPGDNAEPIRPDLTNDEWIEWARPIWYGIGETNTLNVTEARSQDDERHICPLQLGTIERCIRLWSNSGDLVLSPFGGIGSEGYQAIKLDRRAVLCELNPNYWRVGVKNLRRAETESKAPDLFSFAGLDVSA